MLTQSITGLGSTPSAVNTGNTPVDNGSNNGIIVLGAVALLGLAFVGSRRGALVEG